MSVLEDINPNPYLPSREEEEYTRKIFQKFHDAQTQREQPFRILGNKSLASYWRESEKRWLSIIPDKRRKSWQSAVVKPVTRNKCIGIIANLLDKFIEPEITATFKSRDSGLAASAIGDLVHLSRIRDRDTLKYLLTLIDCVSLGTAFIQEDYVQQKRKVKDPTNFNPLTYEVEFEEKEILDFEGFQSTIVSPYEVYLGNIFEYEMKNQPYIFRRVVKSYEEAGNMFGHFRNWEFVNKGLPGSHDDEDDGFYFEPQLTEDLQSNDVEILYYQAKFDDEVAIIVNGILLTKVGTPIPYTHKEYSIVKLVFDPISTRFPYGKSLPDKLKGEQDVLDTLYRMVIDKTFLSIFPPLLAQGSEKITTDIVVPGKITNVDSETQISVPTGVANGVGNELQVLGLVENSMDSSSLDPELLGKAASGERSATQVRAVKEGAQVLLGLFGFMVAFMIEDKTDLRIQNILQFWAKQERFITKDGEREAVEGFFQVTDRPLTSGFQGTREIEFLQSELQSSSQDILQFETKQRKLDNHIQKIQLDPDKIRDHEFVVHVKANPGKRESKDMQKALGLEFYDRFLPNPFYPTETLTRETVELFDRDPNVVRNPQPQQPKEEEPSKPGTQRAGNITSQLAAGAQPALKDLIQA